jgi:hypothetical protein
LTSALSEWAHCPHSKVRFLYSGLCGSIRAGPIIVLHFGQKGRLVAIEAGVASWNLNMSGLLTVIRSLQLLQRFLHEISSIDALRSSAKEFDGDLGRHLFHRIEYFVGGIRQPVRVDVDADLASLAAHLTALLQIRDRLFELMPTLRALKFDEEGIGTKHLHPSFASIDCGARCTMKIVRHYRSTQSSLWRKNGRSQLQSPPVKSRCALAGILTAMQSRPIFRKPRSHFEVLPDDSR